MSSSSGIFARLGLIGLDSLEAPILASLVNQSPLLLIGPHGSGKSLLLERIAETLELSWRHYNASLLNFDDLVGYPIPDSSGQLKFIQTPASIWGANAVFIDEISRARVDIQNRLFPIIHEKKVQGLPLTELRYRWAAMNPPPDRDDDHPGGDYANAGLESIFRRGPKEGDFVLSNKDGPGM
jgi:MoxR-like ATPase